MCDVIKDHNKMNLYNYVLWSVSVVFFSQSSTVDTRTIVSDSNPLNGGCHEGGFQFQVGGRAPQFGAEVVMLSLARSDFCGL